MSQYYSRKGRKKLFDPASKDPFVLSRTKLDTFVECPRCSYLDLRLGVSRVQGPSFTLNNAVDELFKREFDVYRARSTPHPMMEAHDIDAVPFKHEQLEEWRDALRRGIKTLHEPTNLILRGGIDDVWVNPTGELHIVDYKATAKKQGPSTEDDLYDSYKRQAEIYQWLFRQNEFEVSNIAYFVYANGRADAETFDGKLEFDVKVIPYDGDSSWVGQALFDLKEMLLSDEIPDPGIAFGGGPCDFCSYRKQAKDVQYEFVKQHPQLKKETHL